MINRVVLIGRLTRDVNLQYTQSGTAVGQFNLAVNRQYTTKNGEREADFISCVIWRKAAENFEKFTHKGSLAGIEGRIQTRHYDNTEGRRIYVTEVVVDNFSLTEKKPDGDNITPNERQTPSQQQSPAKPPASRATPNQKTNPFVANGDAVDISDDDLPF